MGVQLFKSDHRAGLQPEVPKEFAVEEGDEIQEKQALHFSFWVNKKESQ